MGTIATLNCIQQVEFTDFVSSGYVNAQTIAAKLSVAGGIQGCSLNYTQGTGALQADGLYFKPIALAASTPQTLDLTALTGIGGESLTVNRVRELILFNPDAAAGHHVKLYQGATNPWAIAPASANPLWARANNGSARISDPNSTGSAVGNVVTSTSKTIVLDPGTNAVTVYLLLLTGSVA
jgi:hypothetical protein